MKRAQRVLTCMAIASSALVAGGCSSGAPSQPVTEPSEVVATPQRPSSSGTRSLDTEDVESADEEVHGNLTVEEVEIDGVTKSISNPNSIWILVNKQNPLPRSYEPSDLVTPDMPRKGEHQQLRAEAARALTEMSKAADEEVGKPIQLVSGYRSYADQKEIYDRYVSKDGQADADTYSARAGYSEHQTGLAADLSAVNGKMEKFGKSKVGEWTAENAWKYGFILRYTPENHNIVGYESEPWHYRYVGKELAKYYHDNNITALEQAFSQPAAPNYQ